MFDYLLCSSDVIPFDVDDMIDCLLKILYHIIIRVCINRVSNLIIAEIKIYIIEKRNYLLKILKNSVRNEIRNKHERA